MTRHRTSLLALALLALSAAAPQARAQTPYDLPPEAQRVLDDLGVKSVGLAAWTARALPGALTPPLATAVPGRRHAIGLRLTAEAGLLPRLGEALTDLPSLRVADSLGGQTLGWAAFGLAASWAPADRLALELGLRLLPPIELCGASPPTSDAAAIPSCVRASTLTVHAATRWAALAATAGRPGLLLSGSARFTSGALDVARQTFHTHTEPGLTLRVQGAPAVSWSLAQLGAEAALFWRLGPLTPRAGLHLDLSAGRAAVDPATAVIAEIEGEPTRTTAVTFPDVTASPPALGFGLHAGADAALGHGFTLGLSLGLTWLGFTAPASLTAETEARLVRRPAAYANQARARRLSPRAVPFLGLSAGWSPPPAGD